MKKIAILGPENTFSDIAAEQFIGALNMPLEKVYYPTMKKVMQAIGTACEYGIIPIENTIDGYVQVVLDLLLEFPVRVINEVQIPIHFAFASNVADMDQIKTIYTQFKTKNQCVNFLEQFEKMDYVVTESNGISYEGLCQKNANEAAIVPMHMLTQPQEFPLVVYNIEDVVNNETRFLVMAGPSDQTFERVRGDRIKTSIIVVDEHDKPGLLAQVLGEFSRYNINLTSIISRPTKKKLGSYYFFMDVEGDFENNTTLRQALENINQQNRTFMIGSYSPITIV